MIVDTESDDYKSRIVEDIDEIFESVSEYEYSEEQTSINTDEIVLNTYISNLKNDIKSKIKYKGYNADEIKLKIGIGEQDYGQIQKIDIIVSQEETNNIQKIDKIEIDINKRVEEKTKISNEEIKELTRYLSEEYQIEENKITIV